MDRTPSKTFATFTRAVFLRQNLNLCCCCFGNFGLAIFEAAHVLKARTAGAFNTAQTKNCPASLDIPLYHYPRQEINVIALLDCLLCIYMYVIVVVVVRYSPVCSMGPSPWLPRAGSRKSGVH